MKKGAPGQPPDAPFPEPIAVMVQSKKFSNDMPLSFCNAA